MRVVFCLFVLMASSLHASEETGVDRELHVMVFHPTGLTEAWEETLALAEDFSRRHDVRVVVLPEGAGDPLTKLKVMLAARQPLDVGIIDVVELSSFLEDDVLLDLQPYFDADETWNAEEYFSVILDGCRDRQGHLRGLPSTFTPYVMYYNQDIFDELGLDYPQPGWTWTDFLEIARKATSPPNRYGVSLTQWLQALAPWIWQNGGRYLSEDASRSAFDSKETVEAFEFLVDLFHKEGVASTDASYEGQLTRGLFQDGRVALYGPVGYWEAYRFKEISEFRWDVCPLPSAREKATSIAMRCYVGFGHSRHPELAYEFIRELAGARLSHTLARIGNGVPGLIEVARSESFLKPDVRPTSESVFLDVIEEARFLPIFANWRELETIVQEEIQGALVLGNVDARTACRRMDRKVDAFLAREKRELDRPRVPLSTSILFAVVAATGLFILLFFLTRRHEDPQRTREQRSAWGLLSLWAIGFVIFLLFPMLFALGLTFTEWSPIRELQDMRQAGFENYTRLLEDDNFSRALYVTTLYSLTSVPLGLALALGLALLVRYGLGAFRAIFYLPVIVSSVASSLIWRWMYDSSAVDSLIGAKWIESESLILPGFVLMSLWSVGGPMLVFLAGLQSIDRTLYEAARIDGAGRFSTFLHVTLPQLTPVILFNLILGVIGAFQTFAQPLVMTNGGPGNSSLFYVLHLFRTAFRFHDMGYAATLGWVLFALLLVLTILLLRSSRHWVHYEGESR